MTKKIEKSSGNVFGDLGFKNPDEMLAKAELTRQIHKVIAERGLKQKDAAALLGLKQPDVSALMNGKYLDFSVDRLLMLLVRLNKEVQIVIKPVSKGKISKGIHVFAV